MMDQGDKSDSNDNEWSIRGPGKAPALLSGGDCSAVSQFIPGKDLQEVADLFLYFSLFLSSFSHKVLFLLFSFSLYFVCPLREHHSRHLCKKVQRFLFILQFKLRNNLIENVNKMHFFYSWWDANFLLII